MYEYNSDLRYECADALSILLPQHCVLSPVEMEALFKWMQNGRIPVLLYGKYDEAWMMAAWQQSRTAGVLSDKWLHVNVDLLFAQNLDGLDDFSLATYAAALLERDHEFIDMSGQQKSWMKMCNVYKKIVDNPEGTVLLNYSWLFNDMLQYAMVGSEKEMRALFNTSLAFELEHGTDAGARRILVMYAGHLLHQKHISEGILALARILETHPNDFEIHEEVMKVMFQENELKMGQMVLTAMARVPMVENQSRRYREYRRIYFRTDCADSCETWLEERLLQSLTPPRCASHQPMLSALVAELVPRLKRVPFKHIGGIERKSR